MKSPGLLDLLSRPFASLLSPTSLCKKRIKIRPQDSILFADIESYQLSITYPLPHCFGMNTQLFGDFFNGEHLL